MLRKDVKAFCKENTKLIPENLDLKTELNKLKTDAVTMSALKRMLKSARALLDTMSDDSETGGETESDVDGYGPDGSYGTEMAS